MFIVSHLYLFKV